MTRQRSKTHPAANQPRPRRRIHEESPDRGHGKPQEPASCPDCGASYRRGRWTWESAPADSAPHRCPACERIASDYPAAVLQVGGGFVAAHREELIALIHNFAERERAEHPLKRVMAVTDGESGFTVTLTDGKLAQSLGRALQSAYEGRLEHPPTTRDKENLVRVHWTRD